MVFVRRRAFCARGSHPLTNPDPIFQGGKNRNGTNTFLGGKHSSPRMYKHWYHHHFASSSIIRILRLRYYCFIRSFVVVGDFSSLESLDFFQEVSDEDVDGVSLRLGLAEKALEKKRKEKEAHESMIHYRE